jgi:uncharacterized protein (TIGR00645 family)
MNVELEHPSPPRAEASHPTGNWASRWIENFILGSRYLLLLFYCALTFQILSIAFDFYKLLIGKAEQSELVEHTLRVLELVDITLIASFIWLMSAGSYYVFIYTGDPDAAGARKRPRSLTHISVGILKEKMAGSLIGISSVHLIKVFLNLTESSKPIDGRLIGALVVIHLMFILGLIVFNYSNAAVHHNHSKQGKESGHE